MQSTSVSNRPLSDIFYTGLPAKKFPDFKRLVEYVLSGALLEKIAEVEAINLDTVHREMEYEKCEEWKTYVKRT